MQQEYFASRDDWRKWLEQHHNTEKEVWLIYYKKHTKKQTISYEEGVEEALCFGWIDSTVRTIDEERYMQKFTPRKKKSNWSQPNKKRVAKMIEQGLMQEAGMAAIAEAKKNGLWDQSSHASTQMSEDLQQALEGNDKAKKNFANFAPSYQREFISWVNSAKREATRQKRIKETVERAAKNQKLGMK